MLQANALLRKATNATTGSGAYQYLLVVTTSRGSVHQVHITTAQARALGFKGLRTAGAQVVQGWWYTNGGFSLK